MLLRAMVRAQSYQSAGEGLEMRRCVAQIKHEHSGKCERCALRLRAADTQTGWNNRLRAHNQ